MRINIKMFNGNNLPHKLLLTTRQKAKSRNAFEKNISTDIKFSKAQISKKAQPGGFLGSLLSKIVGPLMKVAVPLAKNIGTLRASLLGNMLTGKGMLRTAYENKKEKGIVRADYGNKEDF